MKESMHDNQIHLKEAIPPEVGQVTVGGAPRGKREDADQRMPWETLRVQRILVRPEVVIAWSTVPTESRCIAGLPEGCTVRRTMIDASGCINIIVAHPSFPVVRAGEAIPVTTIVFREAQEARIASLYNSMRERTTLCERLDQLAFEFQERHQKEREALEAQNKLLYTERAQQALLIRHLHTHIERLQGRIRRLKEPRYVQWWSRWAAMRKGPLPTPLPSRGGYVPTTPLDFEHLPRAK